MKLAVFGGSGLAGSALVELATLQGHTVRALVRGAVPPGSTLARVEVVRGDALDSRAVAETIAGVNAVISTLGGYRGPASIESGTANVIAAMRESGPNRLVVLQGFHIDFPGDPRNPAKRLVAAFLKMRCPPLLPHGAALGDLLRSTNDVAWTLVRIPRMVNGPLSGRSQIGRFALGPISSVSTGDVAATLLRLAGNADYVCDAPMLVTPRRSSSTFGPQTDTKTGTHPLPTSTPTRSS
jgi:putative NADH-flavin reductase